MKTIKELNKRKKWTKQDWGYYYALKHVMKLIDEMHWFPDKKELEIEGREELQLMQSLGIC